MGKLVLWISKVKGVPIEVTPQTQIGLREDGVLLWGRNIPSPGPPPPPSAGKWASQIAISAPMNERNTGGLWLAPGWSLNIPKGSTHYYLVNPKWDGWRGNGIDIGLTTAGQTDTWLLNMCVYRVNKNGDELGSTPITGSGDYGAWVDLTQAEYDQGIMFLVEVIEKGSNSGTFDKIYWKFNY